MKDVKNVLFIYALFHDFQNTSDYSGSNGRMISVERTLMCRIQPLDCNVTTDGQSIFALKCSCLHLCMPVLSLSSLKSYIIGHICPIQPIKVNINLKDVGFEDGRLSKLSQDNVKWQAVVLKVLNPYILLPYRLLISISSFDYRYFVSSWNQTDILH